MHQTLRNGFVSASSKLCFLYKCYNFEITFPSPMIKLDCTPKVPAAIILVIFVMSQLQKHLNLSLYPYLSRFCLTQPF